MGPGACERWMRISGDKQGFDGRASPPLQKLSKEVSLSN